MDKQTFMKQAALRQPTYVPSDAVKQQLAQVDLIITAGPTGVGKTTIMEHSGIPYITSDVTRVPRNGEQNGIDYTFRTDYDQLMQEIENGEFVQYIVHPNGEFYGTKATSYPLTGPCTIAIVTSTIPLFFTLGFRRVELVYILPPSYEEWVARTNAHKDQDLPVRLVEAKRSIEEALSDSRYRFVINDDLLEARDAFLVIVRGGQADPAQQTKARELALSLLSKIDTFKPEDLVSLL